MPTMMQKTSATLEIDGREVRLTYHLLSRPAEAEGAWTEGKTEYGVRVELSGQGREPEMAEVEGIVCEEDEILAFINTLALGRVTPLALPDVVDDFLAQV